jgi:hypothetical protein
MVQQALLLHAAVQARDQEKGAENPIERRCVHLVPAERGRHTGSPGNEMRVGDMNIQINENLRITSDGHLNLIIQERRLIKSTKEGVPDRYEWKDTGYYGKLKDACIALIDVVAVRSEADSLESLINELHQLQNNIVSAVQGLGEGTLVASK